MQRNKTFSIITIICFCSVIFIPIGLVTMWFTTEWKKKRKMILTAAMTVLYVSIFLLLMIFEPSQISGATLPFGSGNQNVQSEYSVSSKKNESKKDSAENSKKNSDNENLNKNLPEEKKLPRKMKKNESNFPNRSFFMLMFFLCMLFVIIRQNLKAKKNSGVYENPYVDTKQYKLPLEENSKIPTVHFLKLKMEPNEKIIYATETTQKNEEGELAVTNKRVVVFGKSEDYEFPLQAMTAVSSITNSVMLLTCGERKYYIFLPENQMKYALATIRWAYSFAAKS